MFEQESVSYYLIKAAVTMFQNLICNLNNDDGTIALLINGVAGGRGEGLCLLRAMGDSHLWFFNGTKGRGAKGCLLDDKNNPLEDSTLYLIESINSTSLSFSRVNSRFRVQ